MTDEPQPLFHSLVAGGLAGLAVDVTLFPLDTLKTRLQSAEGLLRSGGLRGVYSGLGAAAAGSMPTAALFFVTYDGVKRCAELCQLSGPLLTPAGQALAGAAGEVVCCVSRVPVEVVKQRRQTRPHLSARQIVSAALAAEGVRGLYRGFFSTVMREVPFSVLQLPMWEWLKRRWARRRAGRPVEPWQAAVCGAAAGGVAAAITTPFDVAKTRIMLADRESALAGGSISSALRQVYRERGVRGLYAGILPRVAWISVGGAGFFGAYSLVMKVLAQTQ